MNTHQVAKMFEKEKRFMGVIAIDENPLAKDCQEFGCMIVNLDPSWEDGSHLVAVYINPKRRKKSTIEYFDSYGLRPSNCLFPRGSHILTINPHRFQSRQTTSYGQFCVFCERKVEGEEISNNSEKSAKN